MKFRFKLIPIWQVQLVAAHKDLIGYILESIVHHQFVLICSHNYTDGLSISFCVHFFPVIIQVKIHLSDIFVLNLAAF